MSLELLEKKSNLYKKSKKRKGQKEENTQEIQQKVFGVLAHHVHIYIYTMVDKWKHKRKNNIW